MPTRYDQQRRAVFVALVGAAVFLGGGWAAELWRFGATPDASFARIERSVVQEFRTMAGSLEAVASQLASNPEVVAGVGRTSGLAELFKIVRSTLAGSGSADLSVTVYDRSGSARAWAGRPSEIPSDRILNDETFFVAPGPLGLRLVYVRPLTSRRDPTTAGPPIGSVAVERVLSPAPGIREPSVDAYRLRASIVDVSLRTVYEDAGIRPGPYVFELRSPAGDLMLEAEVVAEDLATARESWRRTTRALLLALLAFTLVGACTPLALSSDGTQRHTLPRAAALMTAGVVGYVLMRAVVGLGITNQALEMFDPAVYQSVRMPTLARAPADLPLLGLLLIGLVLIAVVVVDQRRFALRTTGWSVTRPFAPGLLAANLAAGSTVAAVLVGLDWLIGDTFNGTGIDLLHTSLHPWDSGRLAILAGLLLVTAAALGACVVTLVGFRLPWRIPRHDPLINIVGAAAWTAPGLGVATAGIVPALPFLAMLGGAIVAAISVPYLRPRFRHASSAARVVTLFLVLLVPALLAYPSLADHGEQTKRKLVAGYALQAEQHPQDLQARLDDVLGQIDAIDGLAAITATTGTFREAPDTDRAFFVWRQTDLAELRLTSSVELYASDGALISRFALNFPEYVGLQAERQAVGCDWEVYGEIAPFGSDERNVLHAERAICPRRGRHSERQLALDTSGSVVVHLVLDYQALPFIPSGNPYTELVRPAPRQEAEGRTGQDVEFVVYGWGLQPLFSSDPDAWSLDDPLFERIFASRSAFWTTLTKAERDYTTYVANNRAGIYVVGYPVLGTFDHLVRLAEIATLTALLFVLLALVAAAGSWLTPDRHRFGRGPLAGDQDKFLSASLPGFHCCDPGPCPRPGLCNSGVLHRPAEGGRQGWSGAHGSDRPARDRGVVRLPADRRANDCTDQRRRTDLDQSGLGSGRQHLQRVSTRRDE